VESAVFLIASALSLVGGVGVVTARQPIHSALSLLVVLASLAVLYLLLLAEFLAVLQVILYAGAILVLFLFVIMLLHAHSPELHPSPKLGRSHTATAVISATLLFGLLAGAVLQALGGRVVAPPPPGFGSPEAVGRALFTAFLLPFELAGLLLLVGIVTGVVLGKAPERREAGRPEEGRPAREEVLTRGGRR